MTRNLSRVVRRFFVNARKASKGQRTRAPSSLPSTAADLARACIMPVANPAIPKFPVNSSIQQAKSWAIEACNKLSIKQSSRRTLIALAIFARKEGIAWPSMKTLSEETGDSERTIAYAISKLEPFSLFRRERGGGRKKPTRYYFVGSPPFNQSFPSIGEGQSCPRCTNGTMQRKGNSFCCNLCLFKLDTDNVDK